MSPFKALYGQNPPPLVRGATIPSQVEEINSLTHQRDTLSKELQENLLKAQDQMKQYVDHSRRDDQLEVGDWVYLKLQPYKMLGPHYYGPYKILDKVEL